ncbi:methylglutaconyl-CoA hydratase [Musa troglodytarum]|uniref:Methylglutaconyl-CoA hydratase n=1 Tax=Musa troglodytarum TaxID=320322 RepID=A0A9E7FWG4_9LILI|nr:methylglutaconyl-CoA hydratase [Musa troglodytarum]
MRGFPALIGRSIFRSSSHDLRSTHPTATVAAAPPLLRRIGSRRGLIIQTLSGPVRIERLSDSDSGIIELKLDRPEAKNAIGKEMLRGLQNAIETIGNDSSANVVVVSSSVPKVFCAGADLKERKLMSASEVQQFVNSLRSTFSSLEALSVPTVAVIEGAALGGGLEMALSCDLRVCGLVNYCVPAGEAHHKALQIARDINQKGPLAIRMAKQAINKGLEVDMPSALDAEEECYDQLLETQDRLEGLAAFAEKRKPSYLGK